MGRPAGTTTAHGAVDHVCQVFDGPQDLLDHAVPFLAAGPPLRQHLVVMAPHRELDVARRLVADAASSSSRDAAAEVVPLEAVYGSGLVNINRALATFRSVLARAMDDGASGLRALCLVTDAAYDPVQRRAFAAWEHVSGVWQSSMPVAVTCAYDRRVLGDAAIAELACLHPNVVGGASPPFQLYSRRGQLVLDGEVDTFAAPLLQRVASFVRPWPGERLVVDARGLTFVNHRGLEAIVEGLARPAGGLTLLGTRAVPALLRESLGIGDDLLDVLPWVG
jgi:anti-anti-sigma regulatory factor